MRTRTRMGEKTPIWASRDPLVVSSEEVFRMLAPILKEGEQQLLSESDWTRRDNTKGTMYLARRLGIDEAAVRRQKGRPWIELSVIDRWFSKLGLHVGSLTLYPNPYWSVERWYAFYRGRGDRPPSDVDFSTWDDSCG